MTENTKDAAKIRADLRLKKSEEAAIARAKAMAEYAAETEARKRKTRKLKAMRLAKEAEDAEIAAAAPPKKPARTRKK